MISDVLKQTRAEVESALRTMSEATVAACIVDVANRDVVARDGFLERLEAALCSIREEHEKAIVHLSNASKAFELEELGQDVATVRWHLGTVYATIGDNQLATEMYTVALEIFDDCGDVQGQALVLNSLGSSSYSTGDYGNALEHYNKALVAFKALGNREYIARVVGNLGLVFNNLGRLNEAKAQYLTALEVYTEVHDRFGQGEMTMNIGNIVASQGDYPTALEYYQRAIDIFESLDDQHTIAVITGNIALVYSHCGDAEKALRYNQKALAIHERNGRRSWIGRIRVNLGMGYAKAGNFAEALARYEGALPIMIELGDREGIGRVRAAKGHAHIFAGDFASARAEIEASIAIGVENPQTKIAILQAQARIREHDGELDGATAAAVDALEIADAGNLRLHQVETHVILRDLAQKRVDFPAYIAHNDAVTKINEEIRGQEAVRKLAVHEAEQRMDIERRERDRERALLYGALPKVVADRLIRGEQVSGDHMDATTVLFLDIVGFTSMSHRIPAGHVVHVLEQVFSELDTVCRTHGLTKIKTIGDSYMAAAGVPEVQDDHALRAARAAIEMLERITSLELAVPPELGNPDWAKDVGELKVRVGAHSGPVVAGVIGRDRLQYDVWGDTVNVASRMESTCEPGRVQISAEMAALVDQNDELLLSNRGMVEIKGKGEMQTYWLQRRT